MNFPLTILELTIILKRKPCNTNYSVPIINLSNYNLSNQETQQLKLGFDYCFAGKNKDVRRFLAVNMEAGSVKGNIDYKNLEHFHELTFTWLYAYFYQ